MNWTRKRVFTRRSLIKQEPFCPYATSKSGRFAFNRPGADTRATYTPRQRLEALRNAQATH